MIWFYQVDGRGWSEQGWFKNEILNIFLSALGFFLPFKIFLLEYSCFTELLISAVQQSQSAICKYISP